jgi:hypothetical protein
MYLKSQTPTFVNGDIIVDPGEDRRRDSSENLSHLLNTGSGFRPSAGLRKKREYKHSTTVLECRPVAMLLISMQGPHHYHSGLIPHTTFSLFMESFDGGPTDYLHPCGTHISQYILEH